MIKREMIEYRLNTKESTLTKYVLKACFEDEAINEQFPELQAFEIADSFEGKANEFAILIPEKSNRKIILLGLGKKRNVTNSYLVFRNFFTKHKKLFQEGFSVDLKSRNETLHHQVILGFQFAQYQLDRYKTLHIDQKIEKCIIHILTDHDGNKIARNLEEGKITGDTLGRVAELVDMPSNFKTPQALTAWAKESASRFGYRVEVFSEETLKDQGFHALLAVGQGSANPSCLLIIEYKPGPKISDNPDFGLVGKGVTFDTGGISIKDRRNLHYMKSDMGGAAAVLGTIELAARLKIDKHVIGVIPLAENSVDAHSIRPGDVISSYSGKSIEIIDTDAEGRLILADALSYICRNHHPKILIDLATLTGSAVRTFGSETCALFSHDDKLVQKLVDAGDKTGEKCWRLPLWDEYKSELQSDLADIKNLATKPVAGAITAAKFLEFFVDDHPHWAHLDIAGVAFADSAVSKMKSATGYGVRLLLELIRNGFQ